MSNMTPEDIKALVVDTIREQLRITIDDASHGSNSIKLSITLTLGGEKIDSDYAYIYLSD